MDFIKNFIENKDADTVANKLSESELLELFSSIGFVPGKQFAEFVNSYSYLALGDVEFFGINYSLKEKTGMFARTKALIENYPVLKGYYVVESCGDGYYILADSEDNIYNFFSGDSEKAEETGVKFFDYVLKRLKEAEL